MKTIKFLLLIVLVFTLSNCGAKKETGMRDGTSYEKAIIVKSVADEYKYIRENCPNCQNKSQSLVFKGKKPYDVLTVVKEDGGEMDYYFDISKFFGKF